jgi:hypothetical protein
VSWRRRSLAGTGSGARCDLRDRLKTNDTDKAYF